MGDEEYLKFEVTDQDLDEEFGGYKARRQSKHQQIYGTLLSDSDEEDIDTRPSFSRTPYKTNYTAPISFVAGGIQQSGKKKEEIKKDESGDEDSEDEADSDSSGEIRVSFSRKKETSKRANDRKGEMAGFRQSTSLRQARFKERGVGNWEKHTKGIGAKLLLQMGYTPGKGLGKDLQGISQPIEAQVRKGRGAIGAYGPEHKKKSLEDLKKDKLDDEVGEGETNSNKVKKLSQWRKDTDGKKKVRYVYKSIDEVLEEGKKGKSAGTSELSKTKVIDMTGPEQRVLSGYHAIAGVRKPEDGWESAAARRKEFTSFAMPELAHNLDLLVNMAEDEIVENNRLIKYAENRIVVLTNQAEELAMAMERDERALKEFAKLVDAVEGLAKECGDGGALMLERVERTFQRFREGNAAEFHAFDIPAIAISLAAPILTRMAADWNPLQDPDRMLPHFAAWANLLRIDGNPMPRHNIVQPYDKLVLQIWVPRMTLAVGFWSCRHWAPMIEILRKWEPVIPKWIMENITRDAVLRRLEDEVAVWNPVIDCVPIHSWIFPWINFLGAQFEGVVYPTIRSKLGKALLGWHPSDGSARLMLQPWCNVFKTGEMEAFLANNILPKLRAALQELIINPHEQRLDNWNWVMEWDMIPNHTMAALLDNFFFPKWEKTLIDWLKMDPDYNEVSKWYTGWKNIIPEGIRNQPIIRDRLCTALNIMSASVGGETYAAESKESIIRKQSERLVEAVKVSASVPEGYKELVQKRCEERGILWMPIPNRFAEARQVYKCGKVSAYIDRNVLFVSRGGGPFLPLSVNEMLEYAA